MRRAWLHLPVLVSLAAIAAVALTRTSDGVAGLLLIAGAAIALGVLDLLFRHGARAQARKAEPPVDGSGEPDPPARR